MGGAAVLVVSFAGRQNAAAVTAPGSAPTAHAGASLASHISLAP